MHTISWNGYLTGMFICCVLYYSAVYWFFLKRRRTARPEDAGGRPDTGASAPSNPDAKKLDPAALLQTEVHDMVDEIGAYIKQAGEEEKEKDDLVRGLRRIAAKYPAVRDSVFKEGMQNLVAATVEESCAYRLSAEELRLVWNAG